MASVYVVQISHDSLICNSFFFCQIDSQCPILYFSDNPALTWFIGIFNKKKKSVNQYKSRGNFDIMKDPEWYPIFTNIKNKKVSTKSRNTVY